jgi:hypothetical protein
MLASDPASILNQKPSDLGIPNRFNPSESDSRPKLAQACAAEAFQIVLPIRFQFDRHLACNPGKRNIGLHAAKVLQGNAGNISLAGHGGGARQHAVGADEIATLSEALA